MQKIINTYSATDGTEKLNVTQGNTKAIAVGMSKETYQILLAQNRFQWYDEEAMTDPNIVPVGMQHMATDMFNTMQADIYSELLKTPLNQPITGTDYFSAFVDAQALLNVEAIDMGAPNTFAFVCVKDLAKIRKACKDELKYVEAYVRNGYVGTIGGTNLYVKKDAIEGSIAMATKEAATLFVKTGTEIERNRIANTRFNEVYSRKYYLAALTDSTKAVIIGAVPASVSI